MRNLNRSMLAGAAALVAMSISGPAMAGQNIPWNWNSGDKDVKGKFVHYGDNFKGVEIEGTGYLDYSSPSGSGRWYIPGSDAGNEVRTLNLSMPEGRSVSLQSCQHKTALPDDCSNWKNGVS